MNYKQKIVTEQGGYKGYLILGDEVVDSTDVFTTFAEAVEKTRKLLELKLKGVETPAPARTNVSTNPIPSYAHKAPGAKCCGRGSYNL